MRIGLAGSLCHPIELHLLQALVLLGGRIGAHNPPARDIFKTYFLEVFGTSDLRLVAGAGIVRSLAQGVRMRVASERNPFEFASIDTGYSMITKVKLAYTEKTYFHGLVFSESHCSVLGISTKETLGRVAAKCGV